MQFLYYLFLFIGSIILLLSTFAFVFPFGPETIEGLHTLAKWILYGFIIEFIIGLIRSNHKLYYCKKEWISLLAIAVSISIDSLTGFLGLVKLAKLAKLIKAMKGLKGMKAFKSLKAVKFIKTIKLGKKTKRKLVKQTDAENTNNY
ncbi:hypothetical protein BHU72_07600 [Desulfuribacillus stibiiarsenatis]|uniref:Ion transport domain-containing protein n=1 Tax=Desulfuribacillus stibiiarsenatis TaxID=1390249 RepID=A0A1E5L3M6_9FIRM|nr:hypothetical protein [Desulfuribacillus stibiiarsenatis]OEH84694.1 hypothetical protein BHU72_07600 [Desulfuribacillus stibiiarsenatis]